MPSTILRGQGKALWPTPSGCCTHLEPGVIKGWCQPWARGNKFLAGHGRGRQGHLSPQQLGCHSQASPTICPHARYCWGSETGKGHPQPPVHPASSLPTGNTTPASGLHGMPSLHSPWEQTSCPDTGRQGWDGSSPGDATAGPQHWGSGSHKPN